MGGRLFDLRPAQSSGLRTAMAPRLRTCPTILRGAGDESTAAFVIAFTLVVLLILSAITVLVSLPGQPVVQSASDSDFASPGQDVHTTSPAQDLGAINRNLCIKEGTKTPGKGLKASESGLQDNHESWAEHDQEGGRKHK